MGEFTKTVASSMDLCLVMVWSSIVLVTIGSIYGIMERREKKSAINERKECQENYTKLAEGKQTTVVQKFFNDFEFYEKVKNRKSDIEEYIKKL